MHVLAFDGRSHRAGVRDPPSSRVSCLTSRRSWPVLKRLFDVEGLSREEAARQVWPVTYLAAHAGAVEARMHREIAQPYSGRTSYISAVRLTGPERPRA